LKRALGKVKSANRSLRQALKSAGKRRAELRKAVMRAARAK
jgi:hypothetical protein